ncbi:MAG: hypothetical protein IIU55_07995 [Paludibacteraceae bacterium]|nr:hypothetical protein [Paludibacteraceae bacterium]
MMTTKSIYQPALLGKTLAQIDAIMATMPESGRIDTLNWVERYPVAPQTTFTLAHTDEMLYVRYEVRGELPLTTKTQDLELVNEDACVEIFIADADNTHYWNFEFNPAGVCNASHRKERKVDVVRLNPEQLASIQRYGKQLCAAHWTLLVGIPLALIDLDLTHERARRANLYKCGDKTATKHYASWNAIDAPVPAFHLPEFFGEIQF